MLLLDSNFYFICLISRATLDRKDRDDDKIFDGLEWRTVDKRDRRNDDRKNFDLTDYDQSHAFRAAQNRRRDVESPQNNNAGGEYMCELCNRYFLI